VVDERIPERDTLLEQTEEGGVGGFLTGLGEMMLPQAGLPQQKDLGSIFSDFVEFSRLGDVTDIAAAFDPNSGLDPLERLIAAAPFVGVGAVGVRQGYNRYAKRNAQAVTQEQLQKQADAIREATADFSMAPPPGESYDLTNPKIGDLGGATPDVTQNRQQAAKFEQLAEEARSPFNGSIFRAETWAELQTALYAVKPNPEFISEAHSGWFRGIGNAVISLAPDPSLYGEVGENASFVAAKIAIAKWNTALDLGLVDIEGRNPDLYRVPGLDLANEQVVKRIIDLEIATSGILGPNLSMGTGARVGQILGAAKPNTKDLTPVQLVFGILDELLPTDRVWDWDRMYPADWGSLRKRQKAIDLDAFNGVAAANVAKALYQAPPPAGGEAYGLDALRENNWYPRMHRTAQILSENTPYSVTQVSGAISALSANTKWVPDNLVSAVHIILQTGRPDLVPKTGPYNELFEKAILGAGWGPDLYAGVSHELQQRYDQSPDGPGGMADEVGLTGHFTDPEVAGTGTNIDAVKAEKVEMILKGNLPPWLALRGMKTNTFSQLGADPSLRDLVTIDTHSDRVYWGSAWLDRALAHEGYEKGAIEPDKVYHDPVSGEELTGAEIVEMVDGMKAHGWTDVQIERWKTTLAHFPDKAQQARFLAQGRAHLLVRDEFGAETGHDVQATTWGTAQAWNRGNISKRLESIDDLETFRRLTSSAILDPVLYSHLDGNPSMEKTAAGMLWQVNDTLAGPTPTLKELKAAARGIQRTASGQVKSSILAVADKDRGVTPYADATKTGVAETLRHATPSGIRVGAYERYLSNKARGVLSVQDHFADVGNYRRADGRTAAGFATISTSTDPHPGMVPGDRLVILVDPQQAAEVQGVLSNSVPLTTTEADVGTVNQGTSRNRYGADEVRNLTPHQFGELLQNNDWVAISAATEGLDELRLGRAMRDLRRDVEKAGGQVIAAQGNYPDDRFRAVDKEVPELRSVADQYLESAGLAPLGERFERTGLDTEGAVARADAFDAQPTFNPEANESYEAFNAETYAQYQALVDAGYTFEWQDDYIEVSSDTVHLRVKNDKHLPVFSDRPGFGSDAEFQEMKGNHPIFRDSPVTQGGRTISYNELFRAVHDVFGHTMHEYDFSALGEENAWRSHAAMYTPKARAAMTFETRAQNSWQNFGPHTRDAAGQPLYGTDQLDPNRPFPPQKAGTLPEGMDVVEQPQTSEPSFFVTGLSYADALRIGKKYGQKAVAARHGMLNTDGTYHPVGDEMYFGSQVDPESNTTFLETGQRFSFTYDWDTAEAIPEDPDSLADGPSVEKPMRQISVDLGGEYGGLNWSEVQSLLGRVGRLNARMRLYTHSLNRVPEGFAKASESVVTDQSGATGSILHRSGDQYARHQADVWIPEWENLTLSEDGFEGERSRRGPVETRSIMEIDEEAGMIWFDKDLAISVPAEADVSIGKTGSVFRTLKVNGQSVRELVVDTSGPVPILSVGQAGSALPGPGRTVVSLSKGEATKIVPHAEVDWAPARDALASVGLIPDGKEVKVEFPEALEGDVAEPTHLLFHSDQTAAPTAELDTLPLSQEDADLTDRLNYLVPIRRVNLGKARPELRQNLEDVLVGLHSESGRYAAFQARHGVLPAHIWEPVNAADWEPRSQLASIDTAVIDRDGSRTKTKAITYWQDPPRIVFNEQFVVNEWNRGVYSRDHTYSPDTVSDFEVTLIHEIGHIVARPIRGWLMRQSDGMKTQLGASRAAMSRMVSEYGDESPGEFFAEAFARVVLEPDKAHPYLHELVDLALREINGLHDTREMLENMR
jgi:hypothetical protein